MQPAWYFPHDGQQLAIFYLLIGVIYLVAHLIWDGCSAHTPSFSLRTLYLKTWLVFSSTTLSSSLLFLVVVFDLENPLRYSDAFIMPLVISALCGILVSLSSVVPEPAVK